MTEVLSQTQETVVSVKRRRLEGPGNIGNAFFEYKQLPPLELPLAAVHPVGTLSQLAQKLNSLLE